MTKTHHKFPAERKMPSSIYGAPILAMAAAAVWDDILPDDRKPDIYDQVAVTRDGRLWRRLYRLSTGRATMWNVVHREYQGQKKATMLDWFGAYALGAGYNPIELTSAERTKHESGD